jgi:hypothetical protein
MYKFSIELIFLVALIYAILYMNVRQTHTIITFFFINNARASRHQGLFRHLNYVGTPKQAHPIPIAQNPLKREKNM